MNGIKAGVKKSTKQIAVATARQAAQEPLEILKTAGRQVTGVEKQQGPSGDEAPPGTAPDLAVGEKEKVKARDMRVVEALEAEMKDIRQSKAQGEQVQKQQEEAMKTGEESKIQTIPSPPSRRGRRLMGWARKLKQLATRSETRMPPSG